MLVRLRPAWEDLRCYLTAKGRKRFEVYVCTMAERDYALEIWRLLDPGSHLIGSKQILDRVICVKSGVVSIMLKVFGPSLVLFKHFDVDLFLKSYQHSENDFSIGFCWFCNKIQVA